MRPAYPLMLDVADRLVVIVGGGAVAVRKANGIIAAGGRRVRCVSPRYREGMPPEVERIESTYRTGHLDGAGLAFAATDVREVNDWVVRDARAMGVLVCRADSVDDDPGDFLTPAKFDVGPVVVTVSAGSPALSARVRDGLAARFDPDWATMAEAMQSLRPLLRDRSGLAIDRRAAIFRDLASDEAITLAAAGGAQALTRWLRERYEELR